ncbi:MAG: prephenate dehydrogenase [Chloroflexota bacterium]
MNKITIIGLGLTGNSIGMALKKTGAGNILVAGFDPDNAREQFALRKYMSVDEIAPNLESAVRGAQLVVLATPMAAAGEVLAAIAPFLEDGATVTDTLALKEPVMAEAGKVLGNGVSFVGGHPFSLTVDLDVADDNTAPDPDIFRGAPWCIMPLRGARNEALNTVINLAEALGGKPLFIDPVEHDSFLAAVSQLPVVASAAFLKTVAGSPAWIDMSGLAHGRFRSVSEGVAAQPELLASSLVDNRALLVRWVDQYMAALYDLRTLLANGNEEELGKILAETHAARLDWITPDSDGMDDARLRADLNQAISDSRPTQALMGSYLTERLFRKKERGSR